MGRPGGVVAAVLALALAAGCSADPTARPAVDESAPARPSTPTTTPNQPGPSPTATGPTAADRGRSRATGTVPPPWLGTRPLPLRPDGFGELRPTPEELRDRRFTLPDTVPPLPGAGFAARVEPAPAEVLARSTWAPGCPVGADELTWVRLTFWGFDDRRHTGELLLHDSVARDVVGVFRTLYDARFPLESVGITTRADLDAPPTGDGNGTGAFVCRSTTGGTSFSQHAYGLAVDVNPFHNPYVKGEGPDRVVVPELASAYLDRDDVRPGMVTPGGVAVRAFARIGWTWGGDWSSLKDYQHFSLTGR